MLELRKILMEKGRKDFRNPNKTLNRKHSLSQNPPTTTAGGFAYSAIE
jgi:hypothetical protein